MHVRVHEHVRIIRITIESEEREFVSRMPACMGMFMCHIYICVAFVSIDMAASPHAHPSEIFIIKFGKRSCKQESLKKLCANRLCSQNMSAELHAKSVQQIYTIKAHNYTQQMHFNENAPTIHCIQASRSPLYDR